MWSGCLWYTVGMFPFFLALKYLRPKRGIASVVTLLSVFGVTIGVAIVIIVRAAPSHGAGSERPRHRQRDGG